MTTQHATFMRRTAHVLVAIVLFAGILAMAASSSVASTQPSAISTS
jgi:hypothetical protein